MYTGFAIKDRWWVKYVATFLFSVGLVVLSVWKQGAFAMTAQKSLLEVFSNAFIASGFVIEFLGLPLLIKYSNTFERIIRGLIKFFQQFKGDSVDRKYRNFHRYRKLTKEKEKSLRFWLWYINIFGVGFIAIGGALYVAFLAV